MNKIESGNFGSNSLGINKVNSLNIKGNDQNKDTMRELHQEGVTVDNHLSKLVNLLKGNPDAELRLNAVKKQIQSDTYSIDTHLLSDKLLTSGIIL